MCKACRVIGAAVLTISGLAPWITMHSASYIHHEILTRAQSKAGLACDESMAQDGLHL